jgi:glycosyltransferase involved in cell wall biosynthesis
MLISLVLATKDRTVELARFLESLARQTYADFELLVVDQNPDDRIQRILMAYPRINIAHLVADAGLSRARNVGLSIAKGQVIAFPDDDCWYPSDLLERVVGYLEARPDWGGVAGRTMSDHTGRPLWNWHTQQGPVTPSNVWRRVNSNSIFLRRTTFASGLRFDERLGVGAGTPWGSAEEVDLVLSALQAAYRYACGTGFVLRKHRYRLDFIVLRVLAPLARLIRALVLGNLFEAQFMAAIARGRIRGLIGSE